MNNFRISIAGNGRVGKNSLTSCFKKLFAAKNILAKEYSFAAQLKRELYPLLLLNFGISAFTEEDKDKKFIRPLLIQYGQMWRQKDENHWIDKVQEQIENDPVPHIVLNNDTRFENERDWAQKNGIVIHLTRYDNSGEPFPPVSEDEKILDPILKKTSNYQFSWDSLGENSPELYYKAEQLFEQIFSPYISTWQQDFPIQT